MKIDLRESSADDHSSVYRVTTLGGGGHGGPPDCVEIIDECGEHVLLPTHADNVHISGAKQGPKRPPGPSLNIKALALGGGQSRNHIQSVLQSALSETVYNKFKAPQNTFSKGTTSSILVPPKTRNPLFQLQTAKSQVEASPSASRQQIRSSLGFSKNEQKTTPSFKLELRTTIVKNTIKPSPVKKSQSPQGLLKSLSQRHQELTKAMISSGDNDLTDNNPIFSDSASAN